MVTRSWLEGWEQDFTKSTWEHMETSHKKSLLYELTFYRVCNYLCNSPHNMQKWIEVDVWCMGSRIRSPCFLISRLTVAERNFAQPAMVWCGHLGRQAPTSWEVPFFIVFGFSARFGDERPNEGKSKVGRSITKIPFKCPIECSPALFVGDLWPPEIGEVSPSSWPRFDLTGTSTPKKNNTYPVLCMSRAREWDNECRMHGQMNAGCCDWICKTT